MYRDYRIAWGIVDVIAVDEMQAERHFGRLAASFHATRRPNLNSTLVLALLSNLVYPIGRR